MELVDQNLLMAVGWNAEQWTCPRLLLPAFYILKR